MGEVQELGKGCTGPHEDFKSICACFRCGEYRLNFDKDAGQFKIDPYLDRIVELKQELHEARDVIGYYAQEHHWHSVHPADDTNRRVISEDDLSDAKSMFDPTSYPIAGKRARKFQRKYGVGDD